MTIISDHFGALIPILCTEKPTLWYSAEKRKAFRPCLAGRTPYSLGHARSHIGDTVRSLEPSVFL